MRLVTLMGIPPGTRFRPDPPVHLRPGIGKLVDPVEDPRVRPEPSAA